MHAIELNDEIGVSIFRVTCSCTYPQHVVDFYVDKDMPGMVSIEVWTDEKTPFWHRVKNAIKHIFNKRLCEGEVIAKSEDVYELISFLQESGVTSYEE